MVLLCMEHLPFLGSGAKENDRVECICDGFSGSACCLQEIEGSLTGHFQLQICLFGRFLWERALSNTTEMVSGHLIVAYESGLKRLFEKLLVCLRHPNGSPSRSKTGMSRLFMDVRDVSTRI